MTSQKESSGVTKRGVIVGGSDVIVTGIVAGVSNVIVAWVVTS